MTTSFKAPSRFLFIASIGNPRPYRQTRHSAGHILLEAIAPLLRARLASLSHPTPTPTGSTFYNTWQSPSYMNESGPKLLRQLKTWLSNTEPLVQRGQFHPTLVILHDELEAPLGKVRVKRGGPEKASLRGHRGLISIMESLRGKGLYPPNTTGGNKSGGLSVLRIGVGIGRPAARGKGDVAEYVLTEMNAVELAAVRAAAGPVVDILAEEFYREGGDDL